MILKLVAAGDHAGAFAMLVKVFAGPVQRRARRLVGDVALAEDVRQEAFLQAFLHLDSLGPESSVEAWLMTIVRHRAVDVLRRRAREERRFVALDGGNAVALAAVASPELPALERQGRALAAALDRLPAIVRTSLLLHFGEERSFVEVGRQLGERSGTIRARVVRALPALRRRLVAAGLRADAPAPKVRNAAG